ncbi:MAG: HD domain-containing protein [Acutalibacteraceae bacterium]
MNLKPEELEFFEKFVDELISSHEEINDMKKFIQHGTTTTFVHCMSVARYSYWLSMRLPFNFSTENLIRGAILHDFYLYDWHEDDKSHRLHGFYHPGKALKNAEKHFELSKIERDIIRKHMFPLTITKIPIYRESWLIMLADKIVSTKEIFSRRAKS